MFGKGFPFLNSAGGFYPRGNLLSLCKALVCRFGLLLSGLRTEGISKRMVAHVSEFAVFIHPVVSSKDAWILRFVSAILFPAMPVATLRISVHELTNCLALQSPPNPAGPGGIQAKFECVTDIISSGSSAVVPMAGCTRRSAKMARRGSLRSRSMSSVLTLTLTFYPILYLARN